jgi:hypothetical protein
VYEGKKLLSSWVEVEEGRERERVMVLLLLFREIPMRRVVFGKKNERILAFPLL